MSNQNFIIRRSLKVLKSQSIGYTFFKKSVSYEFLAARAYPFSNVGQVVVKIVKNFALYPSGQGVYNYIPNITQKIQNQVYIGEDGNRYVTNYTNVENPPANKQWMIDVVEGYLVSQSVLFALYSCKLNHTRYKQMLFDESLYNFWRAAVSWFGNAFILGVSLLEANVAKLVPTGYEVIQPEDKVVEKLSVNQTNVVRDWFRVDGAVASLTPGFVRSGVIWYAFLESIYNVSFAEFYFYFAAREFKSSIEDVCRSLDEHFKVGHNVTNAKAAFAPNISNDFKFKPMSSILSLPSIVFPSPPVVLVDFSPYVYKRYIF